MWLPAPVYGRTLQRILDFAPKRVLLITAVVSAVIMGDSMLYNVLPSQIDAFGIPIGLVGALLSANRIVRLFSNPLAAIIIQRFGIERPVFIAAVVAIGTTVTYGVLQAFALLLLARILWGVCFSVLRLSGYLTVLDESVDDTRGRLMGVYSGGTRAGSVVGVLLGGVLFDVMGRASSFLIIASFGVLGLPAAIALGRQKKRNPVVASSKAVDQTRLPENTLPVEAQRHRFWDLALSPLPELGLRERRRLLAANFTFFAVHLVMNGVLIASLGFYLSERLEGGALIAGFLVGVATINGILLATRWIAGLAGPYLGYLGDRRGREIVLLFATPASVIALILVSAPVPTWLTVLWLPLAFVATSASTTSLDAIVGSLAPPNRRAKVMSRYATWQDAGSATGPLVAFAVLSFTSLTAVYLSGAVLLSVAISLLMAASRLQLARHFRPNEQAAVAQDD